MKGVFTPRIGTAQLTRAQQYALKGGPLAREPASKTDETTLSWPHERFFSSLVFATVATALYQLGRYEKKVAERCGAGILCAKQVEPTMEALLAAAMTSEASLDDRVAERSMWISKWRLRQFESNDL